MLKDDEAISYWKNCLSAAGFSEAEMEERIIMGNKKDNFWEMGETGPCGPCTEIHVDSRSDEERKKSSGKALVNNDHPQVIEIWNVVFIQHNRKKDGSLEPLSAKHVDTGMGFERLVRVLQNKQSNYDTDVFTGTIAEVEKLSGKKYTNTDSKQDVAFRVIADHTRAIAFPISDGQLPSNTGAGYVIRRILRRAVRYYFSYLDVKEPMLFKLIPLLADQFKNVFPELDKQKDFVGKVVHEEEQNFLRTVGKGIDTTNEIFNYFKSLSFYPLSGQVTTSRQIPSIIQELTLSNQNWNPYTIDLTSNVKIIDGKIAFTLYDRFGFPFDLSQLIAQEKNFAFNEEGFGEG